MLVASELHPDRASLFAANFPTTTMICGDLSDTRKEVTEMISDRLGGSELDVLFATPPCQGMSKNGRGKLLRGVRDGCRPALDPRNQLALLVPPFVWKFQPKMVVFENVPEMAGTLVENQEGELQNLLECLRDMMPNYHQSWQVVEFADYGVPQRRQRLITLFIRGDVMPALAKMSPTERSSILFPSPTHSQSPNLLERPWITVNDAIGDLPPLDARSRETAEHPALPFHRVPVLDERKYWWVENTPEGATAFDNKCADEACNDFVSKKHTASRVNGINRASTDTPIFCSRCGSLLPRPTVETADGPRLMKGFTSAYKRMRADLPSSAMTRNLSYACSDQKLHPSQNRVLSLHEAMCLQTIFDYDYKWVRPSGAKVSDKLIRDSIGESVPPRGLEVLFRHFVGLIC